GTDIALRVCVRGTEPLTYQWLFQGNPVADATNDTLIVHVSPTQAGDYSVIVANSGGMATSDPATLTISEFLITDAHYANGTFTFSFGSKSGLTYVIEFKNTLDDPLEPWHFLQNAPGTGGRITINDPTAAGRSRFYQVRVQ